MSNELRGRTAGTLKGAWRDRGDVGTAPGAARGRSDRPSDVVRSLFGMATRRARMPTPLRGWIDRCDRP